MSVFAYNRLGRFYKTSSTHIPVLIKCVLATDGPILELGTGLFSTPVLHWLCSERKRMLVSYDDNEDFYRLAKKFQSRYHRIRLVDDWGKANFAGQWSVALIDQSSRNRRHTAIRLKDNCEYVLMHDTESEDHYRYQKVWPHFKYRYDYTKQVPWTSVLSNTNDLKWLESRVL